VIVLGHGSEEPGDELNSRASFDRVLALEVAGRGVDGVELDVRLARDGRLVVRHDPLPADLGGLGPDTLVLAEVLDLVAGRLVNVEIKNYSIDPEFDPDERVTEAVLALLHARGGEDRVLISCFGMGAIDRVREIAPHVPTAFLLFHPGEPDALLDPIVEHGHTIVHPFARHLDQAFMEAARARRLTVNVWTVRDDEVELGRLVDLGVDGIITGRPDRLLSLLQGTSPGS
jgi:glycerophosphoryl diester phosphodiesterase